MAHEKRSKIPLAGPISRDIKLGLVGTWGIAVVNALFLVVIGAALDRIRKGESLGGSIAVLFVVLVAARVLLSWGIPALGARAAGVLERDMRGRVYRSVMALGAPVRSQEQTGRIVATGTQSVELASVYYATFLGPIIGSMTTPLVVLVVIAVCIDVQIALVLFAFVVLIPLTVGLFQRAFQKVSDDYTQQSSALSAKFLDALQGLATLKLFNQGRAYGAGLAAAAEQVRKSIMRLLAGNQLVLFVVDTVFSLGMVTVAAWLAMVRLRDGAITPGQAVAVVLLGLLLIEPLDKVGQFFYVGMSGIASAKDVRTQLAQPLTLALARSEALPKQPTTVGGADAIELDDVCFSYLEDVPVLDHVSMRVRTGEQVAVIGASGSGKTTVANLVMRFLDADSGVVRVGGVATSEVDADWTRSRVALVAQNTFLFTGTLRDNLLIARPDATDDDLRVALSDANLGPFLDALPSGLDTEVGERGLAVSGGQAQRIAIARAFLKDAPILLLDEPTSNVDLASEAAIVAAIDRLARGRTVLVIAHRLATVRGVDRIVVLDGGVVVEEGTHAELIARGGHYARAIARTESRV